MKNVVITLTIFSLTLPLLAEVSPIYVAPTGNDATGTGTTILPYKTIPFAVGKLTSGGTLVIKNGTYIGPLGGVVQPPSGTMGNFTTIRAENDGGAVIDAQETDTPLRLTNSYIRIEGMKFINGDDWVGELSGNYLQVIRCAFGNGGTSTHDGILLVDGTDSLTEDCWMWGRGKAGVQVSGARATLRRLVIRLDYYSGTLGFLGVGLTGDYETLVGADNTIIENVITLDFGTTSSDFDWKGGFRSRELAGATLRTHRYFGTIALNLPYDGYRMSDSHYENVVAWGVAGRGGLYEDSYRGEFSVKNATVSVTSGAGIRTNESSVSNSVICRATGANTAGSYNVYYQTPLPSGSINALTIDPQIQYITKPGNAVLSNGQGGTSRGATIVNRYQDGVLTNIPLWPWPNEARIKADFQTNFGLAGVNPKRGFTLDGNDAFGKPMTLTRYIWQYLGNEIPADIYATAANTYTAWHALQTWGEADSSPSADPDDDGYSNLMEYAYNSLPLSPSLIKPTTHSVTIGNINFSYIVDTTKTDLIWQPKISENLTIWTNFASKLTAQSGRQQTWKSLIPISDAKKFIRLEVSKSN